MQKNVAGEKFSAVFQKISSGEKSLCIRGEGSIKTFHRISSISQFRKKSSRNPSVFQNVSGIDKFVSNRGNHHFQ